VGASFAKTGDQVSMVAGVSRASVRGESDISLGGAVGVDMVRSGSTTVSAQGGIAWRSSDGVTGLRFRLASRSRAPLQRRARRSRHGSCPA